MRPCWLRARTVRCLPRRARARGLALWRGGREDDVPACDREERMHLAGAAVQRLHGDLRQGDEVALGGVEHVGDAAAIAVARQVDETLDAMAIGLDPDPFAPVVHAHVVLGPSLIAGHGAIIGVRSAVQESSWPTFLSKAR